MTLKGRKESGWQFCLFEALGLRTYSYLVMSSTYVWQENSSWPLGSRLQDLGSPSEKRVTKTIPKKKKCKKAKKKKKAKWLSEEALQIAEKRKETKGKGEKGRYIHLNAEF